MSYERANISRMTGYAYGEQPADTDIVKLNTNENPYPPSPAVREALAAFDIADLRRYPPATAGRLCRTLADRLGVDAGNVVATNGGDEGLRLAMTTFADAGATFGMAEPSYSLYPVLATVQDCVVAAIPLGPDWTPSPDFAKRLNAAGATLTCIVNPHAPSGVLIDAEAISTIADALDGVLLVDEAYVDFCAPECRHDLAPLVRRHDNLLLLRTLSKGYSLAGLRVGFLVGDKDLIDPIRAKTRDSFNVDAIAQTLATAALEDLDYAQDCWRAIRRERGRLSAALDEMGCHVADSQTNFLLARIPAAPRIFRALRELRVFVRHFDQPRLADCLRITVGTPDENSRLLEALAQAGLD